MQWKPYLKQKYKKVSLLVDMSDKHIVCLNPNIWDTMDYCIYKMKKKNW